jgi:hypothetical protein
VVAFAIILGLVLLFAWVLRRLSGGRLLMAGPDKTRTRQPRLGVVDIYDLDRQRQLILLRRDNVEHLLLVGGPNDVVVETNIVRAAGARLSSPMEPYAERAEPAVEPPAQRPQVEVGRPALETQLAAELDDFVKRPSSYSDAEEELAPIATVRAPVPPPSFAVAPEPMLKPDVVEPVQPARYQEPVREVRHPEPAPFVQPAPVVQPAPFVPPPPPPPPPVAPSFHASPPRVEPEPPVVRAVPVPEVQAPEVQAPEIKVHREPADSRVSDAAILSDMAKHLEEALKRPIAPAAPEVVLSPPAASSDAKASDEAVLTADANDRFDDSQGEEVEVVEAEETSVVPPSPTVRPAPEPGKAVHTPPPPLAAAPTPAASSGSAPDPFSVEEIEAEFARLLGRPGEKK